MIDKKIDIDNIEKLIAEDRSDHKLIDVDDFYKFAGDMHLFEDEIDKAIWHYQNLITIDDSLSDENSSNFKII